MPRANAPRTGEYGTKQIKKEIRTKGCSWKKILHSQQVKKKQIYASQKSPIPIPQSLL